MALSQSDVSEVNRLIARIPNLQAALASFGGENPINSFTVGSVRVSAAGMQQPPQMLDTIKSIIQQQLDDAQARLNELGVGEGGPPTAAPAAPARPAPRRPGR